MSLTVQLPYRHFPDSLRNMCFNALRTGYYSAMRFLHNKKTDLFVPVFPDFEYVSPKSVNMKTTEFRENLREITSP
jgi:hypothetical protein